MLWIDTTNHFVTSSFGIKGDFQQFFVAKPSFRRKIGAQKEPRERLSCTQRDSRWLTQGVSEVSNAISGPGKLGTVEGKGSWESYSKERLPGQGVVQSLNEVTAVQFSLPTQTMLT